MKKKYYLLIIWIFLFNVFSPFFLFVNAAEQPSICSWPSEYMSMYFDFQREMADALLNSDVTEKSLTVWYSDWWLFTQGKLQLHDKVLNAAANGAVWQLSSILSSSLTYVVVILVASASVVESNVWGLAILLRDRVIVRDYKELMDIETRLFNVALSRSKQLNLMRQINTESKLWQDLSDIIAKYRDNGLLKGKDSDAKNNKSGWWWESKSWWEKGEENGTSGWWWEKVQCSMSDYLGDLVAMNGSMRLFLVYWWDLWENALKNYRWCLWDLDWDGTCKEDKAVLMFSEKAITQLKQDYPAIWSFTSCNDIANSLKWSISKWIDNNRSLFDTIKQDIEDAHERLRTALKWGWNPKDNRKNTCEWISEYEMAQLKAYYWSDWECWDFVNFNFQQQQEFNQEKEVLKKKFADMSKGISNTWSWIKGSPTKIWNSLSNWVKKVIEGIKSLSTTSEKRQKWKDIFWDGTIYNPEFSFERYAEYGEIYESVMDGFYLSQTNAIWSELATELTKIKWLVQQVDEASDAIWWDSWNWLKKVLRDIAKYQCSG